MNLDFLERASRGVDRLTQDRGGPGHDLQAGAGVMEMSIDRMDLTELVREVFQAWRCGPGNVV